MIIRWTLGNIRYVLSAAKVTKIMGINSQLGDDDHILMWDFDHTSLFDVCYHLRYIQHRYMLSDIHILETNHQEGNYVAYCFTRTEWHDAVAIVASTHGVDWNFVRLSVFRGWFTLRVGEKKSGKPKLVKRLEGLQLADVKPEELKSWVEYETLEEK